MKTAAQCEIRSHVTRQVKRATKGVTLLVEVMGQGDVGALHDVRVQLRTLGSILQPFLGLHHVKSLRRCLAPLINWVGKSNPVRDAEAQLELISELLPEPYPPEVQHYLAAANKELVRMRARLARSRSLAKLPGRLRRLAEATDECLGRFSQSMLKAVIEHCCEVLLFNLRGDCAAGLHNPKQWHATRLRIKQLRYLIECYHAFLGERFHGFAADTKLAQNNLGRLRDWQNLGKVMAEVPVMDTWLATHIELEAELTRQAAAAMAFLETKLAGWE